MPLGGIYVYVGVCKDRYTGKTTVPFSQRTKEHFRSQKTSSVHKHREKCTLCKDSKDITISIVEDYRKEGKFTQGIPVGLSDKRGHY